MKRILFSLALFTVCVFTLQSQKIIALQNGSKTFFHQRLDTIMAHAAQGDTIYLPGVNYDYGKDFIIDKELHIFGVGHVPDSTRATGITGFQNNIRFITGSDNSSISGIYSSASIFFGSTTTNRTVSNVSISRCNVAGIALNYTYGANNSPVSFTTIYENVIRGTLDGGYTAANTSAERNIITKYIQYFQFPVNTYFKNNILLYMSGTSSVAFASVSGVLIENNIICALNPFYNSPLTQCTLNNNLFTANITVVNAAIETNTANNNIVNVPLESIFTNYPTVTYSDYNYNTAYQYSDDFRLATTCPGKNAGTDGTDIGIFGTETPYKDVPENPHVSLMENASKVINGKLGVNVTVEAQSR